jgi:hypothetical protein
LIRVSASAFDILWTDLGFARGVPEPLSLHSVGGTHEERAEIRQAVYDNLADRGLVSGGSLDSALEARLDLLATAEVYVECEALADMSAEAPFRAVTAARGKQAVLATQPSQTIALSSIRESEVFSAIVELLPELYPGPGYGVSLPVSALGGGVEDPVFGDRPASGRSGSHERQLSEVLAIQARPVYGAGQFSVRVRDEQGKLRRAGGVSWFATDVGAYFGTVSPGRGGQEWLNVTPADAPRLISRLAAILDQD